MTTWAKRMVLIGFLFATTNSYAEASDQITRQPSPSSKGWIQSYLVNTVFALEYEAVLSSQMSDGRISPAIAMDEQLTKLWARNKLALLDAADTGQRLPNAQQIYKLTRSHEEAIKAAKAQSPYLTALSSVANDRGMLRARIELDLEERFREAWVVLTTPADKNLPTCTLDFAQVARFADHQRALTLHQQTPNPKDLTDPIKEWGPRQIECLVFAFLAASPKAQNQGGYDPLILLQALHQSEITQQGSEVLKIATVIPLLEKKLYAEALRHLMDLQDSNRAYRLVVDSVQRIFSIRQQGAGKVAIRGI